MKLKNGHSSPLTLLGADSAAQIGTVALFGPIPKPQIVVSLVERTALKWDRAEQTKCKSGQKHLYPGIWKKLNGAAGARYEARQKDGPSAAEPVIEPVRHPVPFA